MTQLFSAIYKGPMSLHLQLDPVPLNLSTRSFAMGKVNSATPKSSWDGDVGELWGCDQPSQTLNVRYIYQHLVHVYGT